MLRFGPNAIQSIERTKLRIDFGTAAEKLRIKTFSDEVIITNKVEMEKLIKRRLQKIIEDDKMEDLEIYNLIKNELIRIGSNIFLGGKVTRQAVSLVSWSADGVISNHFQGENLVEVAKFAIKSWVSKLREKIGTS